MLKMPFGLAAMAACVFSTAAWASAPDEKLVCTEAPRTQWMGEEKIREVFRASTYALVKFKVSRGNCYEFYAVDVDGHAVEAYYHPVTGQRVRFNQIKADARRLNYEEEVQRPAAQ